MDLVVDVIWTVIETRLRQGEALAKTLAASGCTRAQQAEMLRMLLVLAKLRGRSSQLGAHRSRQYEARMANILTLAARAGIRFGTPEA